MHYQLGLYIREGFKKNKWNLPLIPLKNNNKNMGLNTGFCHIINLRHTIYINFCWGTFLRSDPGLRGGSDFKNSLEKPFDWGVGFRWCTQYLKENPAWKEIIVHLDIFIIIFLVLRLRNDKVCSCVCVPAHY